MLSKHFCPEQSDAVKMLSKHYYLELNECN